MGIGQVCSYDAKESHTFLSFFCWFTLKFFSGFTFDSHRCVLGGDEQYYYTGPVIIMLRHQMFMYTLVHITSSIASSLCGHGVDCASFCSYICCVINSTIPLCSHCNDFVQYIYCCESCLFRCLSKFHRNLLCNNSHNTQDSQWQCIYKRISLTMVK
jgi:hypothetical protein